MTENLSSILHGRRKIVFIGESGSGKSEVAINFAVELKRETDREIHFFDMDQTKPLFRSRDIASQISREGVIFHSNSNESIEDVAAIPSGVIKALTEEDNYVILDIGGNAQGARMIGQFTQYLNRENCVVFFLINPYRLWSRDLPNIEETIKIITSASRTVKIEIISNPNFGMATTSEDVIIGNQKLKEMLNGLFPISFVCALEHLCPELEGRITDSLVPMKIYILYPWLQ